MGLLVNIPISCHSRRMRIQGEFKACFNPIWDPQIGTPESHPLPLPFTAVCTGLAQVWVQVGYLQYRQVPYSHPARYEFLWGPRAYAETSKQQVKDYLPRVNGRGPRFFSPQFEVM